MRVLGEHDQALDAAQATLTLPAGRAGATFRGTVTRAPSSVTDTLDVRLARDPLHSDTVRDWAARPNLPAVGERCLVEYDDDGQPHVIEWYLGAALAIAQQAEIDALAAGGGDKTYHHPQASASTSWVVVHNLGKHPTPDFFDSTGRRFQCSYEHDSLSQLTATLVHATAGDCYCN